MAEMNPDQALEAGADLYRNDHRIRALIDGCVVMARRPIDPEDAERDAVEFARRAALMLAGRIYGDDAELRFMKAERDDARDRLIEMTKLTPGRPIILSGLIPGAASLDQRRVTNPRQR